MRIRQIHREQWAAFLENFSRRHGGQDVLVQSSRLDIGQRMVRHGPLRHIRLTRPTPQGPYVIVAVGQLEERDAETVHRFGNVTEIFHYVRIQGGQESLELRSPGGTMWLRIEPRRPSPIHHREHAHR